MLLYVAFTALNLPQSSIISEEIEIKDKMEHMLQDISNEKDLVKVIEKVMKSIRTKRKKKRKKL